MKKNKERYHKGYEIVCFHPKINGKYGPDTGETSYVLQTDDVTEVAAWFSRRSWGSCFGNNDLANPTVYFNGKKWPGEDEPNLGRCS